MPAEGNEAVTLRQLKEWSDTLGGGVPWPTSSTRWEPFT